MVFGTVKLTRNAIKSKFTYNHLGIGFKGACEGSYINNLLEML